MYEIANSVLDWIRAHKDEINVIAAGFVAAFTGLLLCVAWRQNRISRILQRAYITVETGGLRLWSSGGTLVAYLIIRNSGNLPATNLEWDSIIEVDPQRQRSWFPIDNATLDGSHTVPPRGERIFGSPQIGLQKVLDVRDSQPTCYIYVWGRVRYRDGFGTHREFDFCHRYNYAETKHRAPSTPNLYELSADKGRHHQY